MSNLTKSEIVKYLLDCVIRVIVRRKTNFFAIKTLAEIIKQLESEYDFLRYIKIDTEIFSETFTPVQVDQQIDSIEKKMLGKAFSEIIDKLSKSVSDDNDYYIIREIRDELKYEIETTLQKFDIDLNLKQFEYVVFKYRDRVIETTSISNSEALKPIVRVLVVLLNKIYSEEEAVKTLSKYIKNLEVKYNFLKYITVVYIPISKEFYSITISPNIDDITPTKIGKSLEILLHEIGSSITWNRKHSFIDSFKIELGADKLQKISKMDIRLDHINVQLKEQKHKEIAQKIIETLFDLLIERTSKDSAVTALNTTIIDLQNEYEFLSYIKIDTSKIDKGMNIVQVKSEINNVKSYELRKAFRDIIKIIHDIFGDKTFIPDFKKRLGEEFMQDIENMGVNLHFLEIRYS
jgi:hypothetical protein